MTMGEAMGRRIVRVLVDHPDLAVEFYSLASEIVDDFEDYGPVLQADENGEYSEETVIRRLQRVRNEIISKLRAV